MTYFRLISIFGLLTIGVLRCHGLLDDDEVSISKWERSSLDQLKNLIGDSLTQDYMKRDIYLIKWLRATNLDVKEAKKKLDKMLEWRKEFGTDNLMKEDFSDFLAEFPFNMDSVDHIGRPVGTAEISDWDVRKIILSGRRERAIRFVFRMAEIGILKVVEAYDGGRNISTGIILANLKGFNTIQHGCSECLPVYRNLVIALDSYYPNMIHKLIGINTPMSFYPVFRLFSPLLSRYTRDIIKLYGTDKRQWKPALLSLIPADQLEPQYGGTKKSKHFDK